MKKLLRRLVPVFDLLLLPAMLCAIAVMRFFRRMPARSMRLTRRLLEFGGVYPILDNYGEPLFKCGDLRLDPGVDRNLPGVDLNVAEQLRVLARFAYQTELRALPLENPAAGKVPQFYYHNTSFESGDAEYLYSFVRSFKPARIIEIGSGYSTLITQVAICRNRLEDPAYRCQQVCIDPYAHQWDPWLDQLPVEFLRQRVESVPYERFRRLQANDILFIDSSHVIRPQGDVLFEYLEVLPVLVPGVFIHIHDIFTPRDYPALRDEAAWFMNEQYLLEALLTHNPHLRIIGALNYLAHHHREALADKLPIYAEEKAFREPGSFWLQTQ